LGAVKNPKTLAQCWSFYPAKILGAPGDAGAVTTNDKHVANYVRGARNHFKDDNRDFGINSRLDNVWAAELNILFRHLPSRLERRKAIADKYGSMLWALPMSLPQESKGRVWQDYIIRTPERDKLFEFLKTQGIETLKNEYPWAPGYTKPPMAAQYERETLRLPCNPEVTDEEVEYVIAAIQKFYAGF
jgi:dTDP-4-amino-4,6-dideoxygalactose transaminase